MPRWTRWVLVVVVSATVGGFAPTAVPPARADCVYVEFYITREDDAPIYPLGPDPCVYPTDWDTLTAPSDGHTKHGLPEGTPNGYYVKVGVPAP